MLHQVIWTLLILLLCLGHASAVEPDEILDDPVLEARARQITADLRCVVCQGQSVDDSDSDIARDMRLLVRELIVSGRSDREVFDYIVDRYGSFVLSKPPFQENTLVLWLGPPIMVLIAIVVIALFIRSWKRRHSHSRDGP